MRVSTALVIASTLLTPATAFAQTFEATAALLLGGFEDGARRKGGTLKQTGTAPLRFALIDPDSPGEQLHITVAEIAPCQVRMTLAVMTGTAGRPRPAKSLRFDFAKATMLAIQPGQDASGDRLTTLRFTGQKGVCRDDPDVCQRGSIRHDLPTDPTRLQAAIERMTGPLRCASAHSGRG